MFDVSASCVIKLMKRFDATGDCQQMLVPTLSPGEIVLMDNLGSHKRAGVPKAIEAAGAAVCFLPAVAGIHAAKHLIKMPLDALVAHA